MKAISVNSYSNPSQIRPSILPDLEPSPTKYLIKVHAAALNFFDLLQIGGKYQNQPPFPWIAGAEFAGVVLSPPTRQPATGSPDNTPSRLPAGTPVFGSAQGAFSTQVLAEPSEIRRIPSGFTARAAAGLAITAPTAYVALVNRAQIQPGEIVVVHAAAGGIGLACLQIAKACGAGLVIACLNAGGNDAKSNDQRLGQRKKEIAHRFGADHVVDYSVPGWEKRVLDLTIQHPPSPTKNPSTAPNPSGAHIIIDPVGLIIPSLKFCSLHTGTARIVTLGFTSGRIEKIPANLILLKNVSILGLQWGALKRGMTPSQVEAMWDELDKMMLDGKFKGTAFERDGDDHDTGNGQETVGGWDGRGAGLEGISKGLDMLQGRETWGKVVVDVLHDDDDHDDHDDVNAERYENTRKSKL